jgi:hypothetical protein
VDCFTAEIESAEAAARAPLIARLNEIHEEALEHVDGAPDASREAKAWNHVANLSEVTRG